MDYLFQQIIALLTTGPGSLAYHLAVTFSIVASLTVTLYGWRKDLNRQYRRLAFGLGLLILLRLALFTAAGLAWQGVVSTAAVLPWAERGVDLLSLLVIVWLWVFPEPSRMADVATLCLGLVLSGLILLGISGLESMVSSQPWSPAAYLNLSWLPMMAISLIGVILLIVRRPAGWIIGLFSVGIIGIASLVVYFLGAGNLSGMIRMAQMIAYPFLIALPLRLSPYPLSSVSPEHHSQTSTSPVDAFLHGLVIKLVSLDNPTDVGKAVTAEIANWMQADICLIALPPGDDGLRPVPYGYDLVHRIHLEDLTISNQAMPVLESALLQARPLRLPGNSTTPDLKELSKALDLQRAGALLSIPYLLNIQTPSFQLILLTPFTGRKWTSGDQERLLQVFPTLAHILQQSLESESFKLERKRWQQEYESTQIRLSKAESDRTHLMELVAAMQSKHWSDLPGPPISPQRSKGQDVSSTSSQKNGLGPSARAVSQSESGPFSKGSEQNKAHSASFVEDGKRE